MITPKLDWVLAKKITPDTGIVTMTDIEDTYQKFEVVAVGPGTYEFGTFIEPSCKSGETVLVESHAEANTPEEMKEQDLYVFKAARVIGVYDV